MELLFVIIIVLIFIPLISETKPSKLSEPDLDIVNKNRADLQKLQSRKPLMFISAKAKQNYLSTAAWGALKAKRLTIDNRQCVICGSTANLQCHHLTYVRLTQERISDLVTLCGDRYDNGKYVKGCHQIQHDHYGYSRITDYSKLVIKPKQSE